MMISIIYINPNGSGIGGKAVVPPLVVFHLRVGDSTLSLNWTINISIELWLFKFHNLKTPVLCFLHLQGTRQRLQTYTMP